MNKSITKKSPIKTEYAILSPKIPKSFDGFKIAHISDCHSKPHHNAYDVIEREKPDIICITGDMLHDGKFETTDFFVLLKKLLTLAPVYMITGNHDLWRHNSKKTFLEYKNLGAILLQNNFCEIERNGEKIGLFGVDDPFSKIPERIKSNIEKSFSVLPQYEGYKILLFHRANQFDKIKDKGYDLILSGHMHGGQIRIPLIGGTLSPTSSILSDRMIFPNYTGGKYIFGDTTMIVNRGLSNIIKIPRLGNPLEVGIITLKHE